MIEKKLEFFGTLNQIDSLSDISLRKIKILWESGNIRFTPDDLVIMNNIVKSITKNIRRKQRQGIFHYNPKLYTQSFNNV